MAVENAHMNGEEPTSLHQNGDPNSTEPLSLSQHRGSSHSTASGPRTRGLRNSNRSGARAALPRRNASSDGKTSSLPRPTDPNEPTGSNNLPPPSLVSRGSKQQQQPPVMTMDAPAVASKGLSNTPVTPNEGDTFMGQQELRGRARAAAPGAVAAVEPSPANVATGVGGAPQGKMRRATASKSPTRPGAVSVVEPSHGATTATTGVGGAPQGKMRRSTASRSPTRPGAVSVVEPATASAATAQPASGVGGAPQGKMRRSVSPTRPGAVSVVEPMAASGGVPTGVGGAPQAKMRRAVSPTRPGAMSVVEPASAAGSDVPTGVGGAPQGKMRRTTASASASKPGAVQQEPTLQRSVSGDSNYSGKRRAQDLGSGSGHMRGLRRCQTGDSNDSGLNAGSAHVRGLRRTQSGDATESGLNGSSHMRGLRRSTSRDSSDGLRASSNHRRGLRKSVNADAAGAEVNNGSNTAKETVDASTDGGASLDPQAVRRKQIQQIMKDSSLSQQEKQAKIQTLMAGGMPKAAPAGPPVPGPKVETSHRKPPTPHAETAKQLPKKPIVETKAAEHPVDADPQAIRRKQMQDIMKDTTLTQREKQLKMQQLMAGGMPKASPSVASTDNSESDSLDSKDAPSPAPVPAPAADPEAIRRKQIQNIMMDKSLTAREKQVKTQALMASGMPKAQAIQSPAPTKLSAPGAVQSSGPAPTKSSAPGAVQSNAPAPAKSGAPGAVQSNAPAPTKSSAPGAVQSNAPAPTKSSAPSPAPAAAAPSQDSEGIRRKQIQAIMMNPNLSPREKQIKTQELMAGGMPKVSSEATAQKAPVQEEPPRSNSPSHPRRGLRRNGTNDSVESGQPGLQRSNTNGSQGSAGPGLRRPRSRDGATNPRRAQPRRTRSGDGSVPAQGADLGDSLHIASLSVHSALTEDSFHRSTQSAVSMQDGSSDSHLEASGRISRRDRLAARETLAAAKAAGLPIDAKEAVAAAKAVEEPVTMRGGPAESSGVGGAPQGKLRRKPGDAASRPGAVSVVEPTHPGEPGAGVGGAPQGKMRRRTDSSPSRAGAVSVVEPSPPNVAATGVGGAPQGKMRRTTDSAASRPGAVSVVEPTVASSSSGEAASAAGVGGAPQGKMRRAGTAPAAKPGAVSVVEPSPASSHVATGVGGAPQGKMRRAATTPAPQPGAVSVAAASLPSEPAAEPPMTGVGGAPQGKFRRTTSPTRPGAVSVVESTSSHAGPTGVGGAPQGKFRRSTSPQPPKPGAVAVVEPSTAPMEPGSSTGVGGAPQGKFRRAATSQAAMPGAVSVVEKAPEPPQPGAATGVGGAPQGKMRRTTNSQPSTPGAVSVVEPSVSEPGGTGVGGAPQGKFRRAATTPVPRPGAQSVVEPASAPSEPGAATGVGGAPQGKMRRTTNSQPAVPGAMSVVETSSVSEPGAQTGVGGAPQGKFRRTTTAPASRPGAQSVVEPASAASEPGGVTGVGGAPQGKMRRTTNSQPAVPGAMSVVETSSVSEPGASSSVGGAPQGKFRRTTTAPAARPGAQSVVEPSSGPSEPGAAPAVGGAPQGKFRRTTTTPAMPGAVRAESGASSIDSSSVLSSRPVIGMPKEPRTLVPSVAVHSMHASEHSKESFMSSVGTGVPPEAAPGAQSVYSQVTLGSDFDEAVNLAERDMMAKARAGSHRASALGAPASHHGLSRHSAPRTSLHGSVSGGTTASSAISRQAQATSMLSMSQSSFASESEHTDQPTDPAAEDSDFNHAVKLVESDLQIKMRMREEARNATVVGVQPVQNMGKQYLEPHEEQPVSDNDDSDYMQAEKEKEMIKIGAQSGSPEHTPQQNRMEQKILQMEQEQQARDAKLEELDDTNLRRATPDRRKIAPSPQSPTSDVFDDESGRIENGFLHPDPEAIRQAEEDGLAIAIAVEEEEPDVYDVELKMYDPEAKPPFYKNRRFKCYSGLICILTVAAIIAASVASAQRGNEVIFITQAPSAAPSSAPTTTRETAVRGELARVIGDIVNEPDTPHEKALDWILDVDPMQLDEFSENLIQRYTLALFYYQTSEEEGTWRSCNPPVEGEDYSCTYLDMNRNQDNSISYIPRNDTPSVRWLSEKHECEWAEVLCHPVTDGNVIGIDIMGQNLLGTLPEELRYLDDLMWLTLSFNKFTGTIPEVYGEFPYMTIFEVTENLLTGQIPGGFFRQPNLLQLNPAVNLFTGTIPPEIGDLTTLHSLFFFGTEIAGTLPTEIGRLEDVRNLWLFDNNGLTGAIPSQIGQLSLLEDLKLSNNGHSGPLPSEMGLLTNLEELLIAGSNMGGATIPEEFWNMSSTIFIDINGAGFGGTISTNIGKMSSLKGLKASRNFFSGTLPSEIGLLDDLLLLWIHVNPDLGGEVPIEVCRLRGPENLMFLNADCAGSVPRIECIQSCCTGCCDEFNQCQVV